MAVVESSLSGAMLKPKSMSAARPADLAAIAAELEPAYAELRQAAEIFADHQAARIKIGNQIRSMTVDVRAGYKDYYQGLEALEREASRRLVSIYRRIAPAGVIEWQRATPGIGDHSLARLLGQMGHPRLAWPKFWARNPVVMEGEFGDELEPKLVLVDGEPFVRSAAQLRQYCGHGRAGRRRAGMTQEEAFALGKPSCKMLVHLLAESIVKAQVRKHPANPDARVASGDLGQFYLNEKAKYSERVHTGPCPGGYSSAGDAVRFVKCKVDGHYAGEGDPFQRSHVNAIALRHLGKRILNELWDAAGDLAA